MSNPFNIGDSHLIGRAVTSPVWPVWQVIATPKDGAPYVAGTAKSERAARKIADRCNEAGGWTVYTVQRAA